MFGVWPEDPGNFPFCRSRCRGSSLGNYQVLSVRKLNPFSDFQGIKARQWRPLTRSFFGRQVKFSLGGRQPADIVTGKLQIVLVPDSPGRMLILDSTDNLEILFLERPFHSDFDGRVCFDKIRNSTMVFQSFITPGDDRMTRFTDRHQGGAELEHNGCATCRATADSLLHCASPDDEAAVARDRITCPRSTICTATDDAESISFRRFFQGHSRRRWQQKRLNVAIPCSGQVWQARCDSDNRNSPVTPPGSGNCRHWGMPTT